MVALRNFLVLSLVAALSLTLLQLAHADDPVPTTAPPKEDTTAAGMPTKKHTNATAPGMLKAEMLPFVVTLTTAVVVGGAASFPPLLFNH